MSNRFAGIAAVMVTVAVLTGCQQTAPPHADSTIFHKETPTMDLAQLPTLKQTQAQMLELVSAVQREVARQVPATAPWRWHYEYSTTGCPSGGVMLYLPKLGSDHGLTDDEWAQVLPAVTRLAADAGLTEGSGAGQNTSGNHDVRIASTDGRVLSFGARVTTVIGATVGCRRAPDKDLWVDGRIPMPPDPQP